MKRNALNSFLLLILVFFINSSFINVKKHCLNADTKVARLNCKIKITVADYNDHFPLAGVTISVNGTTIGAMTDHTGTATLNLPDGIMVVTMSLVGYVSQSYTMTCQKGFYTILLKPEHS